MYEKNVFINCPFDSDYVGLMHAITFAVLYAGFVPRSALEETDGGEERLSKIVKLIRDCSLSVHDISRVEVSTPIELPRFNMPFECGIFYGAMALGAKRHRQKKFLVLDSEPFRYRQTMSDIAGKDAECHYNDPRKAIGCVRRFLSDKAGSLSLPGESHFVTEYGKFESDLPAVLAKMKLTVDEVRQLSYWRDFSLVAKTWITARAAEPGPGQ